ncbi:hypothetical protein [Pseudomonas migulae]|uniref:Uncharacterized protein n=1 Tax=Pseudomonas migulae TaxID=78543 RepID=A0ABY8MY54_9PSED|nr:hypothetical protein [Pseudomonas migulae]WGK92327.1 hypothetical protein MOQ58_09065 [Pseudomonas migulae]
MILAQLKNHVYQVAFFIKSGSVRSDELSSLFRNTLNIGDFEPMLIPEAPGMPPEFPRLQIFTPQGYRLTVSKVRIDFFIDLPLGIEKEESQEFIDNCNKLSDLLESKGFSFSRLGVIATMFAKEEGAAASILGLVTKLDAADVSDVVLAVTKKKHVGKYLCNSVYNLSNGGLSTGDIGLVAIRDINTDPMLELSLSGEDAKEFIEAALVEAQPSSFKTFIGE